MRKLLSLKHWQLFLLLLTGAWVSPSPLREIINSIALATLLLWTYSVVIYGHEKLRSKNIHCPLNSTFFRINIIAVALLYPFVIFDFSYGDSINLFDIFIALCGLYLLFGLLYATAMAAKTIESLAKGKEAHFADYSLSFFLFLFSIVGVWIIQPKVNKLIN